MSLLVCAVLSLTGCSEEMLDDRDKSVSTTELVTTEEDTGITEKDAAEYVESCRSLTEKYTNLIRNIDNYKGVDYKVNAKVVQAMGDGQYRAYYGNSYDELIIVDKRTFDNTKIVEKDCIRVYGQFDGFTTVTRAINNAEEEIPTIIMYAADIADVFTMPGADNILLNDAGDFIENDFSEGNITSEETQNTEGYYEDVSNIMPEDIAGYYGGNENHNLEINIYSSPEGDEIGNWNYIDGNYDFGGDSGYIIRSEDGNYLLYGESFSIYLVPKYENGNIVIELWGETGGELWETMSMIEHYES